MVLSTPNAPIRFGIGFSHSSGTAIGTKGGTVVIVPATPLVYHIVHHDRLPSIIGDGGLSCDATMRARSGTGTTIGMTDIKARRLHMPVPSHPGTNVGDYVPFYFCPRSVMLYVIHKASQPDGQSDLTYQGGQGPIVHLVANMRRVVEWADHNNIQWAYSLTNAAAYGTEFRNDLDHLGDIDWNAVRAGYWQEQSEAKQAEFLVRRFFPWELVDRIGVSSPATKTLVEASIQNAVHQPPVSVLPQWYYQ